MIDVLSDVLRSLKTTGTVYFCDQLHPPWLKEFSGTTAACFHQVRRGGCCVESADVVEHLGPGDFIFLAPGRDHQLYSQPLTVGQPAADSGTLLLCGYCEFTSDSSSPMVSLFPSISILRDETLQQHTWLKSILSQLSTEYMSNTPGAGLVVNKLTEVLMVELIRMNFGHDQQSQLLQALADKNIAAALQCLHNRLSDNWTLEELAREVGMSRAGFAKRFKSLVGQSMFDYLTQLRMQRAMELLRDSDLPLYEISNSVGYESDLSFAKTFKKRTGQTPTAYRRQSESVR